MAISQPSSQPSFYLQRPSSRSRRLLVVLALVALAILGNVTITLAAAPTLLRRPYVQQVYTNSLIVAWTTAESGASEVKYGTSDFSQTAAAISTSYNTGESAPYDTYYLHQATLTGLSANTVYQYKIYTSGSDITPGGSIDVRTAKSSGSTSFRFAAFGDSGQGNQAQTDVAAELLAANPDVVIHTGDLIYNTSTYTHFEERYFQVYDDLIESVWLAPSPGNHDTDYNNGQSYVDVFINPENGASNAIEREMYYSFDYGNAHFSIVTPEVSYGSGSNQYDWLEADLAGTSQYWKFVVFHVPPYFTSSSQSLSTSSTLRPLFEQYGVDIVFSGDRHWYERFKPLKNGQLASIQDGAVVYVITGGGGTGLGQVGSPPWHNFTAAKAREYHFTQIDVNGCEAHLSAVNDSGSVFDTYTLDRCEGPPVADFAADVESGTAPLTVNFTDLSSRGPTSWAWTFGDGGTSTAPNPSHTYNTGGTYTVTLTATNGQGSDPETKTNYIVVTDPQPPVADFSADSLSGQAPLTVNFSDLSSNNPTSWSWTFGDGGVSTVQNPSHTYDVAGTYEVSLTASHIFGDDTETKPNYITVFKPTARFKTTSYEVHETGSPVVTVTVELTGPYSTPISVNYATSDGTAIAPGDYTSRSGSLEFAANVTEQSFTVPIKNDNDIEDPETINLTLSGPSASEPRSATITILDDDAPPVVRFNKGQYNINEADGTAEVTVELSHPYHTEITVAYSSSNGTAVAGSDYSAVGDTLTFTPGAATSQTISVPIINNETNEDVESFSLQLSNPTVATPGSPSIATVTITDDDPAPDITFTKVLSAVNETAGSSTVTVQLSAISDRTVTVDYSSSDDSATAGEDYSSVFGSLTFLPGETTHSFAVPILDDLLDEAQESFTIRLNNAQNGAAGDPLTLSINDNDEPPQINFVPSSYNAIENGVGPTLIAQLSSASGQTVSATYLVTGTAESGADFAPISGQLSFAPGELSATLPVSLLDDDIEEGSETIIISLNTAQNGLIGADNTATVTILDNEGPPLYQFSAPKFSANEGDDFAIMTVILSGSSANEVMVGYTSNAGTAVPNDDYLTVDGTLSFSLGVASQEIKIPLVNNDANEADETFSVTLSAVSGALAGDPITAEVVIIDDDPLPVVNLENVPLNVNENDGSINVTAQLSAVSEQTVQLEYSVNTAAVNLSRDAKADNGKLIFAPGEQSKTFQVTIADDATDEPDESLIISLQNPKNVTIGPQGSVQLTVKDDDPPVAIAFSTAQVVQNEGAGTAVIDVILSAPSGHVITVKIQSADITANAGSDYVAVNDTLTFAPGVTVQTVAIKLLNDEEFENSERLSLTLSEANQATVVLPDAAVVTIIDNDGHFIFFPLID